MAPTSRRRFKAARRRPGAWLRSSTQSWSDCRAIRFSAPGAYRLWAESHTWAGGRVRSDPVEVTIGRCDPVAVMRQVALVDDRLAWAGLSIGVSRGRIESILGTALSPTVEEESGCGGVRANIDVHGCTGRLTFSGTNAEDELTTITVRLPSGATVRELREALKQQLESTTITGIGPQAP